MTGVDPVLQWILRLALVALLGGAALHKLSDLAAFTRSVADYRLLPAALAAPAAAALAATEGIAAISLPWPGLDPLGPALACGLLLLYAGAIAANLVRGRRHIDCGCLPFGVNGRTQPLSPALVARNAALCAGALVVLAEPSARPIGWVDAPALAGGVALLALLWSAAHRLAAAPPLPGRPPA